VLPLVQAPTADEQVLLALGACGLAVQPQLANTTVPRQLASSAILPQLATGIALPLLAATTLPSPIDAGWSAQEIDQAKRESLLYARLDASERAEADAEAQARE
jgi:hypothetical protein